MRHLKFSLDSEIILEAIQVGDTTPAKAIQEAIEFVKENNLRSVDLKYEGFTMLIEPGTSLKRLVSEFINWRSNYGE